MRVKQPESTLLVVFLTVLEMITANYLNFANVGILFPLGISKMSTGGGCDEWRDGH